MMVGSRRSVVGGVRSGGVKKEEILVNVQVNGNDEIDLVPVNKSADYGRGSSDDRDGDEEEEEDYEDLSDNPDSDPDLLETEDGRLILDMKRSKYCGRCKKIFKTSAKAHKYKCPGVVDEVQDVILKERKAAKHANPGEEFHKYCNPNPDNPCYCCGEDVSTAHVGHIRCKFCPKSFKAYEYMERHLSSIHSESDAFPCCYCNAKCSTQEILDEHLKTHDEGKPYACMACGKDFTRRYHLDRHEKHTKCGIVPKEVEVLPCEVCGKEFTRIDNLREHLRSHMGQGARKRDYQCPYCSKSFYGSSLLNIHIRTHTGEKPFPCDLCPMSFPSTGALRKHRRKHTGERPYRCDECSATFAARETLNRHRKTHTGEKPHVCQECGKRFIQATQLRSHMLNHSGDSAFQCSECDATFNRKARLTEHIKFTHKGEQPFECEKCSKTFLRKDDLARHELIHSDVKPYECLVCRKFFTTKNAILLHQRTHLEENPVQCKVCSGTFKRSDCLMRHMRTKHRDFLDKIIDDTEKEKMEKLTTTKRETEKEAVVEIDGAIYQITTMDDAPAKGTAYTGNNQTVEVFEVVELPASASDAIPNTLPTTSVPYELVPVVDDAEVILGDSSPVEFVGKANAANDVVVKKEEDSFKKVKSPPKATVVSKPSEPVAPKVVGKASEGEPSRKSVPSTSKPTAPIKPKTEHVVAVRASNEPPQKTPPKLTKEIAREKEEPSTKLAKKPATLPTARPKEAKSRVVEETKLKRKREPKPATPKRMRPDEDSIPIFLSDDMLEQKISELLQMLMGEDMLRSFGWPNAPVEVVLGRVIQGCGHQPAKGEEAGDHTTRMRENTKILFSVTMDDDDIKALLNNHTVDEVIMHVLKNK
ncbi:protein suppressor of hairy wing isoform X2 [Anopheles stephensi]|uniref:protein suppressor of hairy wing isoform X2 n=1 Tax=Anopheles stephensi TaxID=30069 RepID=UPI001658B485|nr:protein suppressor of hairy wing isoform X2 [Anopheles stephensi]